MAELRWTIHRLGYKGGPLSPGRDCWHMGRLPREMPRRGTEEEIDVMPVPVFDALMADLQGEVERYRKLGEDRRWHPFIGQQRRICANRLQALIDRHTSGSQQ